MKKNIPLIILTVITASSVAYAIIQKSEAEKQRKISTSLKQEVEQCEMQAQIMRHEAEAQAHNAAMAMKALEEARVSEN